MRAAFIIVIAALLLLPGDATAQAGSDARVEALQRYWRCLRGPNCQASQVFQGVKALGHFKKLEGKRLKHGVLIKATELVSTLTDASWKADWQAAIPQLASAGYPAAELRKLGAGQSIVQVSPREAIALTRNVIQSQGKTSTTVLFVVLWRTGTRYQVASWDCNAKLVSRFLIGNKPQN